MTLFRRILFGLAVCACAASFASAAEPLPMKWTVDGVERTALVFPPAARSGAEPAPLLFYFHGHGVNAEASAKFTGFSRVWPEALVVYMQGLPTPSVLDPDGRKPGWQPLPGMLSRADSNMGDRDLKFFDAVLATLREKYKVDDRRIYATGFSNGAMFTYLLWASRGDVFAAIAPCAGMITPSLQLGKPLPVLHIAGEADNIVPYQMQKKTIEAVRKHNGCAEEGSPTGSGGTLYSSSQGAPVMTFIHAGGHVIPPGASKLIVSFLKDHPKGQ